MIDEVELRRQAEKLLEMLGKHPAFDDGNYVWVVDLDHMCQLPVSVGIQLKGKKGGPVATHVFRYDTEAEAMEDAVQAVMKVMREGQGLN